MLVDRRQIALAGALLLSVGSFAEAQRAGWVRGYVRDSAGAPVPQADVAVVAVHQLTRAADDGYFALRNIPAGDVVLSVRRLGYTPQSIAVTVPPGGLDSVIVVMVVQPTILDAVEVSESDMRRRQAIEGFYRRRARGIGSYVTREEIEARHAMRVSDAMMHLPGVRFVRLNGGNGVRFVSSAIQRRDCKPQIWVDGNRAEGLELDDLTVVDIEGIEIYQGPATTPMEFSQVAGAAMSCGVIVIWTKVPGT